MSTLLGDRLHALAHLLHQPLVGAAHGGDDAELGRAGGGRLACRLDQARDVEPHRAHRRLEAPGLAAEVAVLGAAAGLDRDDPLDLHLRPAVAHPHLVGELERVVDALVRQPEDLEHLRLVEADAPLEDLLTGDVEDHAGISSRGVWPSGSLPRTGAMLARSSRLHCDARSGSAGQEPITRPRQVEAAALDRLDGERGVVERAEAGAGDEDQGRFEQLRDVGDRAAAEVHEQPAGALDDHAVASSALDEVRDLAGRDAGDVWRARPAVPARAARGSARACAPLRRSARGPSRRRRRRPSARPSRRWCGAAERGGHDRSCRRRCRCRSRRAMRTRSRHRRARSARGPRRR